MANSKILLVDDDKNIQKRVKTHLAKEGYIVETAENGSHALKTFHSMSPDIVILDVTFPTGDDTTEEILDGIEVLRRIRQTSDTPILMLSVTGVGAVKVMALSIGADDYMTKPFDLEELSARIKAVLRRSKRNYTDENMLKFLKLTLAPGARKVWKNDVIVNLTTIEFELLHTLARRPGWVFTRDQLIELAWKYSYFGVPKLVDVHIGHIRKKIEDNPAKPELIVTVRGVGYRFEDTPISE